MTNDNPAWLTAKVDQRLQDVNTLVVPVLKQADALDPSSTLMMFLSDPPAGASDEELDVWEMQCDGCGKDCRGVEHYTGHIGAHHTGTKINVVFVFIVCADCRF